MRLVAFRKRLVINNKRGLEKIRIRVCLKKHSHNLYAPLCGLWRFANAYYIDTKKESS